MKFCIFSVSAIHKEELRWNTYHGPQNQDKVTEPNSKDAEGNLDPSLQFCYFLPWIWVQTCVCGQFRCKAVVRQQLWPSTEGIWACVINEHRPEKVPTAGPCVSSILQMNLLAWENCRQQDLCTVPGCKCPSSDTRNRAGRNCCSVLSWKNGHLNL